MILLLEPPRPAGFVSGGYRYQHEIGRRLAAAGEGELRAPAPAELDAAVAAGHRGGATVVVDGLFVALRRRPLPSGAVALLHMVPDPPWCDVPMPAITTSQPTAEAVAAVARSVEVVRPGLDACFVPAAPRAVDGRVRVVCVGTIGPTKGQRLVAAALAAAPTAAHCDLVLLGDTASAADYVRDVCRSALPATVRLAGVRAPAEVAAELAAADLCVSASRSESFGMAVAEAAACGVPVLAFATGEIGTFVQDGANGWLVPAEASDQAFAARLQALLAEPAALHAARAAARRPPLGDWDDVTQRFVAACRRARG